MNLSNEDRLLLYCAQTGSSEDTLDKVRDIVSRPLNWEEVFKSALWYGIAPLLYSNLKNMQESPFIPERVMDKLKLAYYSNVARNMCVYAELNLILKALCEKDIGVIVLKGAALAKTVYGDIGLRPMGDIDLLVKKEDLPHTEKTMTKLGYRFQGDMPREWYRENHQHISFLHPEKNIPVEIHWHIARKGHPSRIRILDTDIIKGWWEGAKTIDFSGRKAPILCPGDLIVHLSLHFLKHRFISQNELFSSKGALIQLCDILQTLKYYRDEIDWVRLKCGAEKYGIDSPIFTTLFIVKEIMGGNDDVFRNALCRFAPVSSDRELIRLIKKKILMRDDAHTIVPNTLIQSRVAHTFLEKVKILLNGIFPNREIISGKYLVPLSSKRIYLYYVIHPCRLLLKYKNLMWNIPRIKEETVLKRWMSNKD